MDKLLDRSTMPVSRKKKVDGEPPILELVKKFALEPEPVLLTGETGVGKNYVAGLIHGYSRRSGQLVIVDTPNIDGHLFESKLFGHKKGAFTDARYEKTGLVQEAAGGTLFFDEITEVPLDVQARLLRFIDTRTYYRLGESTETHADVRIIAATNKNLVVAVRAGEFRRDLFYRLNVLEIQVPPLRQRPEDIDRLVKEHLTLLRGKETGKGFWEIIREYSWPGNVRELLNLLKRAGIMLEPPLTGAKIASLLYAASGGQTRAAEEGKGNPAENVNIGKIRERFRTGESFWQLLWKPFIARDLDRYTVKSVLRTCYFESSCCFRKMIRQINVDLIDYPKFMSLLYKYNLDPRKSDSP